MIDIGYLNDSEQSEFASTTTSICNLEEVQPTRINPIDSEYVKSVSYTHLTLPTSDLV